MTNCKTCISELVCRYNDGVNLWCKYGNCPHYQANNSETQLKPCPFCGTITYITAKPLWHGSHGYADCYEYDIHCEKCGCNIKLGKNNTVYSTHKEARENAIAAWNSRAETTSP